MLLVNPQILKLVAEAVVNKFETSWYIDYTYFERVYSEEQKKSIINRIDSKYEYYEPADNGLYKCILDDKLKLNKRLGFSKETQGKYGVCSPIYRNIKDCYWPNGYNLSPDVLYLDIETRARVFPEPEEATQEVILVQMFDTSKQTMYVLGLKDWNQEPDYQFGYPVKYVKCKDEITLLQNFGKVFRALNPLIIYAWNGEGFDYPYLFNRMKVLGLDPSELLSVTCTNVSLKKVENTTRKKYTLQSPGHFFMDMMDVYRKFVMTPQRSYSLDAISRYELKDNKIEHTEYESFDGFYTGEDYIISDEPYTDRIREKIRQLQIAKKNDHDVKNELDYYTNFQFVYYGIYDVFLLKKLDDKLHFTQIMLNISSSMGVLFSDALGTVRPWSQFIANTALKENMVMPKRQEHEHPNIVGGFVKEPEVGKHDWVLNLDVNSMYPLLSMVSFNMSAETFVPLAKLPGELRDLILRYFNDQNEDSRFELPKDVWATLATLLKKYKISMAINGACFKQDRVGIIPRLVKEIYDRRKQEKKIMFKYEQAKVKLKEILEAGKFGEIDDVPDILDCDLHTLSENAVVKYIDYCANQQVSYDVLQHTDKILINSLYGAQGNQYFPLFNEKVAQAITGNGRYFIKKVATYIENYLQGVLPSKERYVIYQDTDSCYYQIKPFVDRYILKNPDATLEDKINFCDNFAEKVIQPIIQRTIDDFASELNSYSKDTVGAKREVITDAAIFVSKKKYVARVRDSEGTRYPLDHPKIKIMGLELIKSSTPKFAVDKMSLAIDILLDGNEKDIQNFLKECEKEFMHAPLGDIATITSVNDLNYDLRKDVVPIGSRAAILYNNYITEHDLTSKYTLINDGDKIKRLYIREPNKFMYFHGTKVNANTIAFVQDSFAEHELKDCIDYDLCFKKFFLSPLKIMTDSLKYNIENSSSVDDW